MHQILQNRCPSYHADLVTFNTIYSQRRHLRSSTTWAAAVRRARTQFGKRAFSVCGPDVWKSLHTALRHIDSYPAFRRALTSHLFSCAFSSTVHPYIHWHCNAQSDVFVDWTLEHLIVFYCIQWYPDNSKNTWILCEVSQKHEFVHLYSQTCAVEMLI